MSTILNAMMEEYVSGKIVFGLKRYDDLDFYELGEDEITPEMATRIQASRQQPLSSFVNI